MSDEGKAEGSIDAAGTLRARLYDFTKRLHSLKPKHTELLDTRAVPILQAGGSITIVGLASRTGSDAFNLGLSQRRADEVVAYLRRAVRTGFAWRVEQATGVGEAAARAAGQRDGLEDDYYRAVRLVAWRRATPPPADLEPLRAPLDIDVIDGRAGEADAAMEANYRVLHDVIAVTTVRNMVDKILRRLTETDRILLGEIGETGRILDRLGWAETGRIRRLRIFGHGGAGVQGLGNSRQALAQALAGNPTDRALTVMGNQLLHQAELSRLIGRFAPGGWVELRGCQVGSDSTGGELLQKLADLWRVPVKAGIPDQIPGRGGIEGEVVVAWPGRTELEFRQAPRPRTPPVRQPAPPLRRSY